MYARSAALGILGAIALALPRPSAPAFTLESTGAFRLRAAGPESRYGVVPQAGHVVLSGSFIRAIPFQPGDTVVAVFDRLGEVSFAAE